MLLKVALLVELADGVSKEELHAATDATIIGSELPPISTGQSA